MRFACWLTKATDTPSEYAILTAFSWQQWLHECTSMLRYTYTARLVTIISLEAKPLEENGCFNVSCTTQSQMLVSLIQEITQLTTHHTQKTWLTEPQKGEM
jgi:hypothetical protein